MKTFFSEYQSNYDSYTFWYTRYAIAEVLSEVFLLYEEWFLPYSGDVNESQHIFYFCRSVKVNLNEFVFGSENRRIQRKAEEIWIDYRVIDKSEFDVSSDVFCDFCLWYSQERFSNGGFDPERFDYVISRGFCNKLIKFVIWEVVVWYVLLCEHWESAHYRFSFFDTTLVERFPLGKYMMQQALVWAKEVWKTNLYLWTCYKESWLYKIRDWSGVEWRDWNEWSQDIDRLKYLCKERDGTEVNRDVWKE